MKIFFDGGCRPLPAGMEYALVAAGKPTICRDLGAGTSMEAEWLALIAAARLAIALELADVILLGDAAAVIAQANGAVRCPPCHVTQLATLRALTLPPRTRIRYLRRAQNLAGIVLARLHDR